MKKSRVLRILVLSIAVTSLFLNVNSMNAAGNETINDLFPDAVLAEEVAKRLKRDVNSVVTQEQLNTVHTINLNGKYVEIFEGMNLLTGLKNLSYGNNREINKIPAEFFELTSLTTLYIQVTSIKELPDEIENLTQLKSLSIGNTYIESLPDSIGNLKNLENLVIYGLYLEELPSTFTNLSNLNKLNASWNSFATLSNDQIEFLKRIPTLSMSPQVLFSEKPYKVKYGEEIVIDEYDILRSISDNNKLFENISVDFTDITRLSDLRNALENHGIVLAVNNTAKESIRFEDGKVVLDTSKLKIESGRNTLELNFKTTTKDPKYTLTYFTEIQVSGEALVRYLDDNGNIIAEDTPLENLIGEKIEIEPLLIPGYELIEDTDDFGEFSMQPKIVEMIYKSSEVESSSEEPKDPELSEKPEDSEKPEISDESEVSKEMEDMNIGQTESILGNGKETEVNHQNTPETGIEESFIVYLNIIVIGIISLLILSKRSRSKFSIYSNFNDSNNSGFKY